MKTTFLIITLLFQSDMNSIGRLWASPFPVLLAALGVPLGLGVVLWALCNAPEGYEDAEGFHSKQSRLRIRHSFGFGILRPENAG